MNKNQFETITKWQSETFGHATPLSKMAHLKDEIKELETELKCTVSTAVKSVKEREFADCFILLFGVAASDGMSYEDICRCIEEKMQINYKRKWGIPQANGVVNHLK